MQTARVIQNVVDATADYLATITIINAILGLVVSLLLWALGMPSPFMWGGIVSLCNFVPYLGPIVAAVLLGLGGRRTFAELEGATGRDGWDRYVEISGGAATLQKQKEEH